MSENSVVVDKNREAKDLKVVGDQTVKLKTSKLSLTDRVSDIKLASVEFSGKDWY